MSGWPERHIEALRRYLDINGVTYKKATENLNEEFGTSYSRNSIIGKATREKIPCKNPQHVNGRVQQVKKPRPSRAKHRPPVPIPLNLIPLRTVLVDPRNLTLLELEPADCRWPVSGDGPPFLFCGNPACFGSYCGAHDLLSKRSSA